MCAIYTTRNRWKGYPSRYSNTQASGNLFPEVEYLVVGGGGCGGCGPYNASGAGGGGGGGGVLQGKISVPAGIRIDITVGCGGYAVDHGAGPPNPEGSIPNGGDSIFLDIIAKGGGCGGRYDPATGLIPGADGGSGGGGGSGDGSNYDPGGLGTPEQGCDGAAGDVNLLGGGGGGGGHDDVGVAGTTTAGGNGGVGVSSDINGTAYIYGSGGGGAGPVTQGVGGDGGGNGCIYDGEYGEIGYPGTKWGAGGGGHYHTAHVGDVFAPGHGKEGIVIVRYPDEYPLPTEYWGMELATIGGYRVLTWKWGLDGYGHPATHWVIFPLCT